MIISSQVYPLQQAFPAGFLMMAGQQEYFTSFVVSAPSAASMCPHSLKKPVRSHFSRKQDSGQKSKVLQFPLTIHFYYSKTIQARVYCLLLLFEIPFCLFKEARSSVVSTLNFKLKLSLLSSFSLIM